MVPELKQQWIEALRSGKYQQTVECLRDADGYCCLGVLADIQGVEWIWEQGKETPSDTFVFYDDEDQYDIELPDYLLAKIDAGKVSHLVNMNDGTQFHEGIRRHSFEEIANYIEENI